MGAQEVGIVYRNLFRDQALVYDMMLNGNA